ncbi:(2Fe-2S)-binding protein [Caldimonas mangrovi]|uniref:(2Fe-2S)-binding protein n=1 Tax=Caldimonas mangrovi TaxID=2944811 RepID=UPI0034A50006
MELHVNGRLHASESDPQAPLLWVLREDLGFTGVKFGCGVGACGACTVHLDGQAVRSCTLPAARASGHRIVTIEGLAASEGVPDGELHPLQKAWIAAQVPQCGYCQSGMLMAAAALLRRSPQPSDAEIDEAMTNLCRCGTYPRVRRAIHDAARSA